MAGQPASAAAGVLPVIIGVQTTGVVLGSLSKAVIIEVSVADGPRVVSLLHPDASGVPNGVRVLGNPRFDRIVPGDRALIGAGVVGVGVGVGVGQLTLRVVRTWDSRVRQIRPYRALVAQLAAATVGCQLGVDRSSVECLHAALTTGHRVPAAIDSLVGLGRGLTPGGDDVIAGLLIGLHAVGRRQLAHRLGEQALQNRTTTLSSDLLRLARDGHAGLEALAVLAALHRPDVPIAGAVDRLLSIGHTSGADLATGMAIGLRFERVDDATYFNPPRGIPRFGDVASDLPSGRRLGGDHQRAGGDGHLVEHRTRSGIGVLDS